MSGLLSRPAQAGVLRGPRLPGLMRDEVLADIFLATAARLPGKVFHAGTAASGATVVTSGGRVLCAVGLGATVAAAQHQAYTLVDAIHWNQVQYRRDIGHRAIEREQSEP